MSTTEWRDGKLYYKGELTCCTKLAREALELSPFDAIQLEKEGKTRVFMECPLCKICPLEIYVNNKELLYTAVCTDCQAWIIFYLDTPMGRILGKS